MISAVSRQGQDSKNSPTGAGRGRGRGLVRANSESPAAFAAARTERNTFSGPFERSSSGRSSFPPLGGGGGGFGGDLRSDLLDERRTANLRLATSVDQSAAALARLSDALRAHQLHATRAAAAADAAARRGAGGPMTPSSLAAAEAATATADELAATLKTAEAELAAQVGGWCGRLWCFCGPRVLTVQVQVGK
jgi:hypothetical protein